MDACFEPDWPAPAGVRSLITTRHGGFSDGPWRSFNLGLHVGDDPASVNANRQRLYAIVGRRPEQIHWMEQVHGTRRVHVPAVESVPSADAAWTEIRGEACVVMTADCLPVLMCDDEASRVAIAHAGWRGLAAGVLDAAAAVFEKPESVIVYLGPAIGPSAFEVGDEVRQTFMETDPQAEWHFRPASSLSESWFADLYGLARSRLALLGIYRIFGGCACTFSDEANFYSYRRDGTTGRMASLIWLEDA